MTTETINQSVIQSTEDVAMEKLLNAIANGPKVVLIYDSGHETVINVTHAQGHADRVLMRESMRIGHTYANGTVTRVIVR